MNKEEARKMLIEATRELRQANIVLEAHRQGVEDIQEEIAKLEAIINKPDRWQDGLVQPNEEIYFYLSSSENSGLGVDCNCETERKPEYAFRKKEQAELIKEKMILMQEMYAFAHVRNGGWKPNWHNEREEKFGILFNKNNAYVEYFIHMNQLVFGVAVKSREIAKEMLYIFKERIEKFYSKMY